MGKLCLYILNNSFFVEICNFFLEFFELWFIDHHEYLVKIIGNRLIYKLFLLYKRQNRPLEDIPLRRLFGIFDRDMQGYLMKSDLRILFPVKKTKKSSRDILPFPGEKIHFLAFESVFLS